MNDIGKEPAKELALLRKALQLAEQKRFADNLSPDQKRELESASVAIREREREIIAQIGKEIADNIKESSESLEQLAKDIRNRTTGISSGAKQLNKLSKAILTVLQSMPT